MPVDWRTYPFLQNVDAEGLDVGNMSCYLMGMRELLRTGGEARVAQVLALPLSFVPEMDGDRFRQLAVADRPFGPEGRWALNRGYWLVGRRDEFGAVWPRVRARVNGGLPVLVMPGQLELPYFVEGLNPYHVCLLVHVGEDEVVVAEDLPVPGVENKVARAPLAGVIAAGQKNGLHWFYTEREAPAQTWTEELQRILRASVRNMSAGALPGQGLGALTAFRDWFAEWQLDLSQPTDMDCLTDLFCSMRFNQSASRHVLEVALRTTDDLPGAEAAATVLREIWERWNAVIMDLVKWKTVGKVGARAPSLRQIDAIIALEKVAVERLDELTAALTA